jgi:hypothetical protein
MLGYLLRTVKNSSPLNKQILSRLVSSLPLFPVIYQPGFKLLNPTAVTLQSVQAAIRVRLDGATQMVE